VDKVSEGGDEGELGLRGAGVKEEVLNIPGILGVDVLEHVSDNIAQAMRNREQDILHPLRDSVNVLRLLTGPVLDVPYLFTVTDELRHVVFLVIIVLLVVYN
jgi:hypothetical protein